MILDEKVALITGAGSGIERAAAELLANQGARIGALGRSEDDLLQVVSATQVPRHKPVRKLHRSPSRRRLPSSSLRIAFV